MLVLFKSYMLRRINDLTVPVSIGITVVNF